jgi:hypothetical protein
MRYARIEDGKVVELCESSNLAIQFPADFVAQCVECADSVCVGWEYHDGTFIAPVIVQPSLAEAQTSKRTAINAGFDTAMTASLTMPSASTPASAFAVYQAIEAWKAEDPEGYATLLGIHTARRDELLAAVDAAQTTDAVLAIVVNYAV